MIFLCLFLININAETILDSTEKHYVDLKSYYVEFVQSYCDAEEGICERFIGRVAYKAPNKMRMEIEGAEDRIDLYDGEWFWIYLPKEGKVYKKKIKGQLFDLKNLISNYRERFDYTLIKSSAPYKIEFVPTEGDEAINKMILTISKSFLIKAVVMTDLYGNESKFDFSRFTLNRDISDKVFKLRLPEDVEVIEE